MNDRYSSKTKRANVEAVGGTSYCIGWQGTGGTKSRAVPINSGGDVQEAPKAQRSAS